VLKNSNIAYYAGCNQHVVCVHSMSTAVYMPLPLIVICRAYLGYITSGGRWRASCHTATVKLQCQCYSRSVDASRQSIHGFRCCAATCPWQQPCR